MSKLQEAFKALAGELSRLYGAGRNHDFQDELDNLEAAIKAEEAAHVTSDKPDRGQVTSKVSPPK